MGRKWRAHGCLYFISAIVGDLPLNTVADRYRGRFGIEGSYRILGQATAWTTSRSPALRLLHVAVGMMLPNEWVILKPHYASEGLEGPTGFVVREEPAVRKAPEPAAESRGVQAGQRGPSGESGAASGAPSLSRAIGQPTEETLPSTGIQWLNPLAGEESLVNCRRWVVLGVHSFHKLSDLMTKTQIVLGLRDLASRHPKGPNV